MCAVILLHAVAAVIIFIIFIASSKAFFSFSFFPSSHTVRAERHRARRFLTFLVVMLKG